MIKFTANEGCGVRTALHQVTEYENAILAMLMEYPAYTYTVFAEKMGLIRRTMSARIRQLREKGILQKISSDAKSHWQINSGQ